MHYLLCIISILFGRTKYNETRVNKYGGSIIYPNASSL